MNTFTFSDLELRLLRTAVRRAIRRTLSNRAGLIRQFGDDTNTEIADQALSALLDVYVRFGCDPTTIGPGMKANPDPKGTSATNRKDAP